MIRSEETIPILLGQGLLQPGTNLEILPRMWPKDWREQDVRIFRGQLVVIQGKKRHKIRWEYDGKLYSMSPLTNLLHDHHSVRFTEDKFAKRWRIVGRSLSLWQEVYGEEEHGDGTQANALTAYPYDDFISWAAQHQEENWITLVEEKQFSYRVHNGGVEYTPGRSDAPRKVPRLAMEQFCNEFMATGTYNPGDYPTSRHKSYSLPLIQGFMDSLDEGLRGLDDEPDDVIEEGAITDDSDSTAPKGVYVKTYRVLRDTEMAKTIKRIHGHRCQMCKKSTMLFDGLPYAEGHHIKPLARRIGGLDVPGNILCVCPTCHVRLDYGAIPIIYADLLADPRHKVSEAMVKYHNDHRHGKI